MEATLKRKMLRDMMRIRSFEETLYELIQAGEMNGFLHLYLGEEACAVGVCTRTITLPAPIAATAM